MKSRERIRREIAKWRRSAVHWIQRADTIRQSFAARELAAKPGARVEHTLLQMGGSRWLKRMSQGRRYRERRRWGRLYTESMI